MEKFYSVLLNVWREACRNIELSESIPQIAALLQKDLVLEQILVKRVCFSSSTVETVALGYPHEEIEQSGRLTCSDVEMRKIRRFLKHPDLYDPNSSQKQKDVSFLFQSRDVAKSVLFGSLRRGDVNGIIIFVAPSNALFNDRSKMLLQTLIEPFAVAFENDARLRELTQLRKAAEADKRSLLNRLGREAIVDQIVGQETGLKTVVERANLVAQSDMPVLILGETGTGKEMIARMIHEQSDRKDRPFLRVNCGAIPAELIDSQLFGHVKGAFTGAVSDSAGWFERADGGTLFLDEIGELPQAAQVRFLRVLQDGWFERVGGSKSIHVNVRIVAATNQDLSAMVTVGQFREDLWYRIAAFPVIVPPLRQRKEDIPELVKHFANRAACRFKLYPVMPNQEEIEMLQSYDWPGNIREFASVIDRAAILGNGKSLEISKSLGWEGVSSMIQREPDSEEQKEDQDQSGSPQNLDAVTRAHIQSVLSRTKGRIDGPHGAAVILGVNPHTLRGRMRKLGINWKSIRRSSPF